MLKFKMVKADVIEVTTSDDALIGRIVDRDDAWKFEPCSNRCLSGKELRELAEEIEDIEKKDLL